MAFLIAWAAWIPVVRYPSSPTQLAFIGLFAPALAAFSTAAVFGGMGSVRDIVRRLTILRFPLQWALVSTLIMPAIYGTAIGALKVLRLARGGPLFSGNSPLFIVTAFTWLLFVNSGEEIGWRGFALPLLLERFPRPVLVSLAFGVVWGAWHLPLYLLPGQSAFPFPLFLIFTSLQSVLYTIIFIRTKGSLLPAILLHAGTDIAPRLLQLSRVPSAFWLIVDAILGLVVAALVAGMRRPANSLHRWQKL